MFTLNVKTGSAAFTDALGPGPELARILRRVADQVEDETPRVVAPIMDANGNKVGEWRLT